MALAYFGNLFPNTYYAKGGPGLGTVLDILLFDDMLVAKGFLLLAAPFGFAWLTLVWCLCNHARALPNREAVGRAVDFFHRRHRTGAVGIHPIAQRLDAGIQVRHPVHRAILSDLIRSHLGGERFTAHSRPASSAGSFLHFWSSQFWPHHRSWSTNLDLIAFMLRPPHHTPTYPIVSLLCCAHRTIHRHIRFNQAAKILGVEKASFLLQDVGATLFYSELEIYGLAGLTDATIARTLRKDNERFHDYIFNEVKPTFILHYAYSTLAADLDSNAQFREQYIPLQEKVDSIASGIVATPSIPALMFVKTRSRANPAPSPRHARRSTGRLEVNRMWFDSSN